MNQTNTYSTEDFYLCVAIISSGINLEYLKKSDYKKFIFIFPNSEKLQSILKKYWSNKLELEINYTFQCLKNLKSRMYAEKLA